MSARGRYVFRAVGEADRAAIVEMTRKVYNGNDYVPGALSRWLASPDCATYGLALRGGGDGGGGDGRLVAVENVEYVDDGRTAWLEGLRVAESERGRGAATLLQARVVEEAVRRAGVERVRYTTSHLQEASLRLAAKSGLVERPPRMQMFFFEPDGAAAFAGTAAAAAPAGAAVAAQGDPAALREMALADDVIVDWEARDWALVSVFRRLMEHGTRCFVRGGRSASFSKARPAHNLEATIAAVTVYADTFGDLAAHAAFHSAEAAAAGNSLMLVFPIRFVPEAEAAGFAAHVGGFSGGLVQRQVILLERRL